MPIKLERGFFQPEGSVITTPRLSIRELTVEDIAAYHTILSNPEVTKYVSWGPYTSPDQTSSFVQWIIADQQKIPRVNYGFAIALHSTGDLVGYTVLQVNILHRSAERAIFLKQSEWHQGLASEAQSAMLDFGFTRLGLHRIWATCDPDNLASQKMMQKTGMIYEGRLRDSRWFQRDQRYRDSLLFSILDTEWAKLNDK